MTDRTAPGPAGSLVPRRPFLEGERRCTASACFRRALWRAAAVFPKRAGGTYRYNRALCHRHAEAFARRHGLALPPALAARAAPPTGARHRPGPEDAA